MTPLVPVIISAQLVVAAELRKYGVVGAGGSGSAERATVPDTGWVPDI